MKKKLFLFFVTSFLVLGALFVNGKAKLNTTTTVSAQTQNTDWPQLGYNSQKSSVNPNSLVNAPMTILWRFHPGPKEISISSAVQPVTAEGVICAGYFNGIIYCLNPDTGQVKWQYQTGGPIVASAAITNGTVVVPSQDKHIYGLNSQNGQLLWKYKTGRSVQAAPCIYQNTIYIGSTDGWFYALNIDGSLKWKYNTDFPILMSAACSSSGIYFANENLYAYALTDQDTSASVKWQLRLKGQSTAILWPVVSESRSLVFFRTQPLEYSKWYLDAGDSLLKTISSTDTPENRALEQTTFINYLNGSGSYTQTAWVLDTQNGSVRYTLPVLYTAGAGGAPNVPAIDESRSQGYLMWRTKYETYGCQPNCVRWYADIGKFDLNTGVFSSFPKPAAIGIQVIADENTTITGAQNAVITSARGQFAGINLSTGTAFPIANSLPGQYDDFDNGGYGPYVYDESVGFAPGSIVGGGGMSVVGIGTVGAVAAHNRVYIIARYGVIAAVE